MEVVIVCVTTFLAAVLTLFSGFGLGTLLLPIFAIFFPITLAISMTAVVHLFNNILKLLLLGRDADRNVVLRFGVPALLAAFLGAWILGKLSDRPPLMEYHLFGVAFNIMPVKVTIGILLIGFTLVELAGEKSELVFDKQYLPLGGILSGFFGGLSGHQGALRSAFLIKVGLSKEAFLGSGVIIACLVDFARLAVYGFAFPAIVLNKQFFLLLAAMASAFAGTLAGNHLAPKMTIRSIQILVSVMVLGIAVGLVLGII